MPMHQDVGCQGCASAETPDPAIRQVPHKASDRRLAGIAVMGGKPCEQRQQRRSIIGDKGTRIHQRIRTVPGTASQRLLNCYR